MIESLSRFLSRPDVLAYGILPILGALVGWWTNRIATGMMFSPRHSYGWQGVIPARLPSILNGLLERPQSDNSLIEEGLDRIDPRRLARELDSEYDDLVWNTLEDVLSHHTPRLWDRVPEDTREQLFRHLRSDLPEITATVLEDANTPPSENREFTEQLRRVMADRLEPWLRNRLEKRAPTMWDLLPGAAQMAILRRIREQLPDMVARLVRGFSRSSGGKPVTRDLLGSYVACHREETLDSLEALFGDGIRRVERTGLLLGLLVGLGQGLLIQQTRASLAGILTLGGLVVGLSTNAVALMALFHPRDRRTLGPLQFQGAVPAARDQLASWLGTWAENGPFSPRRILEGLLSGAGTGFKTWQVHLHAAVDRSTGWFSAAVGVLVGREQYFRLKDAMTESVIEEIPRLLEPAHDYARDRFDISNRVESRVKTLSPEQYAKLFRPSAGGVLTVLLVGSILGMGVGVLEWVFLYGQSVPLARILEQAIAVVM